MNKYRLTVYWSKSFFDKGNTTQHDDIFVSQKVFQKLVNIPTDVIKFVPRLKKDIIDGTISRLPVEIHHGVFLIASFQPDAVESHVI